MNRVRDDRGMTLTEVLVATLIFAAATTIIATFLVGTNQFLRNITVAADNENVGVRFNEDFTTAFRGARSVRLVGTTGATSTARRAVRFDFSGPEGECLTYEVVAKTGKPTADYPTSVSYFTYRIGRVTNSAGTPQTICTKDTFANTYVSWNAERWALNPPDFTFYNYSGGVITMPTSYTSASWDAAAYANVARVEYTRKATRPGESTFTTGVSMPEDRVKPVY